MAASWSRARDRELGAGPGHELADADLQRAVVDNLAHLPGQQLHPFGVVQREAVVAECAQRQRHLQCRRHAEQFQVDLLAAPGVARQAEPRRRRLARPGEAPRQVAEVGHDHRRHRDIEPERVHHRLEHRAAADDLDLGLGAQLRGAAHHLRAPATAGCCPRFLACTWSSASAA